MPSMQLQWHDYARLRVNDPVFCHDLGQPYWLQEGVVVSSEPPEVGIYLPHLDAVVFPRLERLHRESADHDPRCRYCRAAIGEWAV
jgi:hypothetical protein